MRLLKGLVSFVLVFICASLGVGSLVSGLYFAAFAYFAAAALFWPSVALKVKQATGKGWFSPVSGLILVFLVAPVLMVVTHPFGGQEESSKQEQEQEVFLDGFAEEQSEADGFDLVQSRIQEQHKQYMRRVNSALASIREFAVPSESGGVTGIAASLAVIESWAKTYEAGEAWAVGDQFDLSEADQEKRQELRRAASRKQVEVLPRIRDIYGPVMRGELWEIDASARTIGSGFRTVEFVSFEFARNINIKKTMEGLHDSLMRLRFNQVRFKWSKHTSEYTYYDLESPKDSAIVIWGSGGQYRLLE